MNVQNILPSGERTLERMIQNGNWMCVYLPGQRMGLLPDSISRQLGLESAIEGFPEWVLQHGGVGDDSIDAWKDLFERIHRGDTFGSAMLTLRVPDNGFSRLWVRFNAVADDENRPCIAMISFDDFTQLSRQFFAKDDDINGLLLVAGKTFPEVMILNLTSGTYRRVQNSADSTPDLPREGSFEQMHLLRRSYVLEEDRAEFINALSADGLKKAFLQDGRESVRVAYRRFTPGGDLCWMETTVARQQNLRNNDLLLVAMVRNVDEQKALEARMHEEIRVQSEELRIVMSKMGKVISYYDIPRHAYSIPQYMRKDWNLPNIYEDFPEAFIAENPIGMGEEMIAALRSLFAQIHSGAPSGSCEYPFTARSGRQHWERLEFATIYDDRDRPMRAVIAMEDVTAHHIQTEENARLRASAQVLEQIAQHSERDILYYDCASGRLYSSDRHGKNAGLQEYILDDMLMDGRIPQESHDAVRRMQRDICAGIPSGQDRILYKNSQSQRRWLDVKYSSLFDAQAQARTTLVSLQDITQQHDHEIAYLRAVSALEGHIQDHLLFMECDLNADLVEKITGIALPEDYRDVLNTYSALMGSMIRRVILPGDREKATRYFSINGLLRRYTLGERILKSQWPVKYRDGSCRWFNMDVTLIEDPYSHHVKAFLMARDITEEIEMQMEIQHRAERDGMTGLLNRSTAEAMIRKMIAEENSNGILMVLDLDDLKGINDVFGHNEGDRAILAIADTLKAHFRETDVIVRFGGDEFLIYLPGAAASSNAIAVSIVGLLRKLAGVSIGKDGQRRIYCSVGCAVQNDNEISFETLYRQADTALYHVKRTGKNNFAFYSPEMEQANFQFQARHLFSRKLARKYEAAELYHLLQAIAGIYQLVMSVNLSANDYYLMEEIEGGVFANTPTFGVLDDFIRALAPHLHPDDEPAFMQVLSREALLRAYDEGSKNLRHRFRFRSGEGYRWAEATVVFYENEVGNICEFSLIRWMD